MVKWESIDVLTCCLRSRIPLVDYESMLLESSLAALLAKYLLRGILTPIQCCGRPSASIVGAGPSMGRFS